MTQAVQPAAVAAGREARPTRHYRPDIDGLRAIAVIAVLGYHAFPARWPGGFVGVDVFFVISGYLITGLILSDLSAGRFTFFRFYGRRARRIFPALALVLSACAVAGWAFLLPDEWSQFGRQTFAGAAFISNLAFASEHAAYFDFATHLKPVLHLWSLGVEEQFYFVWPLLLFALRRRRRTTIRNVLAGIAAGSFLLNVALVSRHAAMAFYLPVTRLWELALGSIVAVHQRERSGSESGEGRWDDVAGFAGLALCIASVLFVRERGFPGLPALAPTLGTMLLTASGGGGVVRRLLASRMAVTIGLISYPLYLWHWPLISFARIWEGGAVSPPAAFACLAASFVLAAVTYRFVETPIRTAPVRSRGLAIVTAVLAIVAAVGLGAAAGAVGGRLRGPAVSRMLAAAREWEYPFGANFGRAAGFETFVVKGQPGPAVLFIGDSHLEQYWPRIALLTATNGTPELRFATNGGCPPLRNVADVSRLPACNAFFAFATDQARRADVGTVILGAAWPAYLRAPADRREQLALAEFSATIASLVANGKRVYVILSSPASPAFSPRSMVSRLTGNVSPPAPIPLKSLLVDLAAPDDAVRSAAARGGATVVDPLPWLCPDGSCPAYSSTNGPIYRDSSHLRPFYVRQRALFLDPMVALPRRGR